MNNKKLQIEQLQISFIQCLMKEHCSFGAFIKEMLSKKLSKVEHKIKKICKQIVIYQDRCLDRGSQES